MMLPDLELRHDDNATHWLVYIDTYAIDALGYIRHGIRTCEPPPV